MEYPGAPEIGYSARESSAGGDGGGGRGRAKKVPACARAPVVATLAQSLSDSLSRCTRHDRASHENAASVEYYYSVNSQNGCSVYLYYPVPPPRLVSIFLLPSHTHSVHCTTFLGRAVL